MVHSYVTLHKWQEWLTHTELGRRLMDTETQMLSAILPFYVGKHALLIGSLAQITFFEKIALPCHTLVSMQQQVKTSILQIESDFAELPLATGSADLVLVPHTLEFVDNPRQLLTEVCRCIKPEGIVIIFGFNPTSLWGLKKYCMKTNKMPWMGNYIHPRTLRNWLALADFMLEKDCTFMHLPPFEKMLLSNKLRWLESVGQYCFPYWGNIYALVARAKVIPLTPIRMQWKQKLAGLRVPTSISGHY